MNKRISLQQVAGKVKDGDVVMIGGFLGCGTPQKIVDELVASGVKDLTLICNDTAFPEVGIGKLIVNKQVKKVIASHIGTNKETGRQMMAGETEVDLVPQGTLAERIRAGGFGLGGILTATGVGTEVEKGKQVLEVDGKKYLLEKPLRANVALIYADVADEKGNLTYRGSTRNFNSLMAAAADVVAVEATEMVPLGAIDPNAVMVPAAFVNYIVEG